MNDNKGCCFQYPFFYFTFIVFTTKLTKDITKCTNGHTVLSVNFVPLVVDTTTLLMDYNVPLITLLTPSLKRILLKLMSIPSLGTPDKRFPADRDQRLCVLLFRH